MKKIQTAVLAGGRSRRMGQDKAMLLMDETTFLSKAVQKFSDTEDVLVSVRKGQTYPVEADTARSFVEDQVEECGPMGALLSLLNRALAVPPKSGGTWDALFVFAVDMPFVDPLLKNELQEFLGEGIDAVIPVTQDARVHPLCALYRPGILPLAEQQIADQNYRMQDLLRKLRVCYVPANILTNGEYKLQNINTYSDYEKIHSKTKNKLIRNNQYGIPILSVTAYSGSGKTTFLEKLIKHLTGGGIKIAVLKHDGHDFDTDKKGKDTWRFAHAGASQVILISDTKCVTWEYYPKDIMAAIDQVKDADLILVEGLKHWPFPKALLYRQAAGKPPAFDPEKQLPVMIISDADIWPQVDCPKIGLDDIEEAAEICKVYMKGKQ